MIFESCTEIRSDMFDYLENLCTPEKARCVRYHLRYCVACREDFDRAQTVQTDLRTLSRSRVSPDVALKLRVLLSQELHRNLLGRLWVRLENALQPLLLPASAGVLTAIIFFGLIMGAQFVPETNAPDVPLQISTPPRLRALGPNNLDAGDQAVVVVTRVNAEGRVMGYKVLSGQHSPELLRRLDLMMYFSLFQPATMFGRPTDGQVVLSLRQITVRG